MSGIPPNSSKIKKSSQLSTLHEIINKPKCISHCAAQYIMSGSSKRQQRVRQNIQDEVIDMQHGDCIVQIVGMFGGNRIQVEFNDGSSTFCRIPNKYKDAILFRKGMFVIISPMNIIESKGSNDYSVSSVLFEAQIKQLIASNQFPDRFMEIRASSKTEIVQEKNEYDGESISHNPNRAQWSSPSDSSSSEDEEEE